MEPILAANVSWIHAYREATALAPATKEIIRRVEAVLTPRINEQPAPLRELTDTCDDQLGLSPGMSLTVVRHLIANRRWQVEMNQPINPAKPLILITAAPVAAIQPPRGKKAGRK